MDNLDNNPNEQENQNIEPQDLENAVPDETNDAVSFKNRIDLSELEKGVQLIKNEIGKVIVGQKGMID